MFDMNKFYTVLLSNPNSPEKYEICYEGKRPLLVVNESIALGSKLWLEEQFPEREYFIAEVTIKSVLKKMNKTKFKEQIFTYQDLQQIFEDRLAENKDIYMKEFDFTKEVEYNTYADSEVQQMFTGFVAGFLLRHTVDFI